MDIIQKLPDDIFVYIYTKILRKYRLHEGKHNYDNKITYEIKYYLNNLNQLSDRKDLFVDDDMMYVYLTFEKNTIKYYIQRFRLKKIEDKITKIPSIYHKGDYADYDWEVFSYTYEI